MTPSLARGASCTYDRQIGEGSQQHLPLSIALGTPLHSALLKAASQATQSSSTEQDGVVLQASSNEQKTESAVTKAVASLSRFVTPNKIFRIRLGSWQNITASGAGLVDDTFPTDPSVSADWSALALLFDEFRVVSMRVRYEANSRYYSSTTSITQNGIGVMFDNNDNTALSSLDQVVNASHHKFCSFKSFDFSATRPQITPSAYWTPTASPGASPGSIKMLSGGNPASALLGTVFVYYNIEARMRE